MDTRSSFSSLRRYWTLLGTRERKPFCAGTNTASEMRNSRSVALSSEIEAAIGGKLAWRTYQKLGGWGSYWRWPSSLSWHLPSFTP